MIEKLWLFNVNRRVYRKGTNVSQAPIWIKHWEEHSVVGETKRSWVTAIGIKVPKKGGDGIAFSWEEVERQAYVEEHRLAISRKVRDNKDPDILRRVAELVGYVAPDLTNEVGD